ncbi:hypothetical protein QQ008_08035 [Fulvivirgaceae bacterium BMA10]|uniref:WD40-like Beta Propeller Repeat n=1 Tax=Splendidivirga corallicola TaxID=3051826 RepID=A0ABT8KKR2_9BACT|nr:hypothetical protein [Fulvivirgaceae bacterium BMA10]
MKNNLTLSIFLFPIFLGCSERSKQTHKIDPRLSPKDFLESLEPDSIPKIFLPDVVSTGLHEHNGILSPEMDRLYYTVSDTNFTNFRVLQMPLKSNLKDMPTIASFSGEYTDHAVSFSPDGNVMYFSSTRPQRNLQDWDLWYSNKTDSSWNAPQKMSGSVNTNLWESHASVTRHGSIYFQANYDGGGYNFDIYVTHEENNTYKASEKLSSAVNSELIEATPFIAPDESYIIFTSYNRADGYGDADLYISFKNENKQWTTAMNMGPTVNSVFEESNPNVSADGAYFFFSSKRVLDDQKGQNTFGNGSMDVYWMKADIIEQLRTKIMD